jgi:Tfp pilus assembly protein PilN
MPQLKTILQYSFQLEDLAALLPGQVVCMTQMVAPIGASV